MISQAMVRVLQKRARAGAFKCYHARVHVPAQLNALVFVPACTCTSDTHAAIPERRQTHNTCAFRHTHRTSSRSLTAIAQTHFCPCRTPLFQQHAFTLTHVIRVIISLQSSYTPTTTPNHLAKIEPPLFPEIQFPTSLRDAAHRAQEALKADTSQTPASCAKPTPGPLSTRAEPSSSRYSTEKEGAHTTRAGDTPLHTDPLQITLAEVEKSEHTHTALSGVQDGEDVALHKLLHGSRRQSGPHASEGSDADMVEVKSGAQTGEEKGEKDAEPFLPGPEEEEGESAVHGRDGVRGAMANAANSIGGEERGTEESKELVCAEGAKTAVGNSHSDKSRVVVGDNFASIKASMVRIDCGEENDEAELTRGELCACCPDSVIILFGTFPLMAGRPFSISCCVFVVSSC